MNIFFDVDYTLLGGLHLTLRPYSVEVISRLRDDGHDVYVWSGEGERWEFVRKHGLVDLVNGVYGKPLHDYRARLTEFKVPVTPDFVIDDYPGIVRCFSGICIPEYLGVPPAGYRGHAPDDDRVLEDVYEVITRCAAGEVPDYPRYYPGDGEGAAVPRK